MQALALALVASVTIYTMGQWCAYDTPAAKRASRFMRQVLWVLLVVYLLSPFVVALLPVALMMLL